MNPKKMDLIDINTARQFKYINVRNEMETFFKKRKEKLRLTIGLLNTN